MGSRAYDNDTTISSIEDNRIGVSAEAEGSVAAGGNLSIQSTTTSNITTNNTTVESEVAKTAVKTIGDAFNDNSKGLQDLIDGARQLIGDAKGITRDAFNNSQENLRIATALSSDSVKSIERVATDNLASTERNLREALQANSRTAQDAFNFTGDVTRDYFTAGTDLNKLVQTSGREFLAGAQTLVKDVLSSSQSEDAKNYQATLGALVKIAIAIAAALTVPYLFKAAK